MCRHGIVNHGWDVIGSEIFGKIVTKAVFDFDGELMESVG